MKYIKLQIILTYFICLYLLPKPLKAQVSSISFKHLTDSVTRRFSNPKDSVVLIDYSQFILTDELSRQCLKRYDECLPLDSIYEYSKITIVEKGYKYDFFMKLYNYGTVSITNDILAKILDCHRKIPLKIIPHRNIFSFGGKVLIVEAEGPVEKTQGYIFILGYLYGM